MVVLNKDTHVGYFLRSWHAETQRTTATTRSKPGVSGTLNLTCMEAGGIIPSCFDEYFDIMNDGINVSAVMAI